ncbi:MAG: MFS transporter [Candidatus Heimdallarchaeota archaeon]|nr:MFS transporter [Candidatus Heimdallarchaeota archaeon]
MFRRGLFYTYLSIYLLNLGLSVTATTLFATIPMVLSAFFQTFVWGQLSDKMQKRRTFIITGEMIAGSLLIIIYWMHDAVANTDLILAGYTLIVGLGVLEIFWSMSNIGWSALVSDLYPSSQRTKIIGGLQSIGGMGGIVGVLLGGFLYDFNGAQFEGWGFREGWLFYIAAGVIFLSILPILSVAQGGKSPTINSDGSQVHDEIPEDLKNLSISLSKIFLIFIIALFILNIGRNSIAIILSQYFSLNSGFNVNSQVLDYIMNMRSVAVIITGLLAGSLSNRIGHRKALIFGVIISIASLFLTGFGSQLWIVYGGKFLMGSAEVIINAASYAYAATLIPYAKRAKLFGVYNASFFISWGVGATFIVGPLIDSLLNNAFPEVFAYQMGFLASALITMVGLGVLVWLEIQLKKAKKNSP